jgi:hypothetical protein
VITKPVLPMVSVCMPKNTMTLMLLLATTKKMSKIESILVTELPYPWFADFVAKEHKRPINWRHILQNVTRLKSHFGATSVILAMKRIMEFKIILEKTIVKRDICVQFVDTVLTDPNI